MNMILLLQSFMQIAIEKIILTDGFHWEYYAFDTPIWRERFNHYKAIQNHETNEIVFPTDEVAEEFYQKYGYEPDEQPRETDEKSTKDVEEINYKEWQKRVINQF